MSLPFPNLLIAVILAGLDAALVSFVAVPWIVMGTPWTFIVLSPILGGVIGALLSLETYLLWLARGRSKTGVVIASAKPKRDDRPGHLWDSDLDG